MCNSYCHREFRSKPNAVQDTREKELPKANVIASKTNAEPNS